MYDQYDTVSFKSDEQYVLERKFEDMQKTMTELVKLLYSNEPLNLGHVDDRVGQLCDELNLSLPDHLPRIRRTYSELFEFAAAMNQ